MLGKIIFWGILILVLYFAYKKAEKTVKSMDLEDKRLSEEAEMQSEESEIQIEKNEIEEEK